MFACVLIVLGVLHSVAGSQDDLATAQFMTMEQTTYETITFAMVEPSPVGNVGNEFVILFLPDVRLEDPILLLSTPSLTQVQVGIRVPGINYQHSTTISRDSGQSVILPSSVFVSSEISNKTVIVEADAGITVHTMVIGSATANGFLAVPIIGLGSSYVVASYYPLSQQPSHFAISSFDSETDIEITTSTGNVIQLTLPPYHSYIIQDNDLDLTGSRIEANKPVAVFSGAECSYVPRNIGACDHLAEQMLPLDNLGKSFYIAPFPSRKTAGYIYRIIATNPDDATHVSITGGIEVYLEVGEFFEGHAGGYDITSIEADYPIITVQYMKGRKSGDSTGDPAMLLIPPYEMFSHNVTFSVFDDSRFDFYHASVTISCEDISGLFLDDSTAIDDHWVILSDSDMTGICALQGAITPGVHTIGHTNPNTQFYVAISAVGSSVSYAYSAGFNLLYHLPEDDLTTVQLTTSGQTTYGTTTFAMVEPSPVGTVGNEFVILFLPDVRLEDPILLLSTPSLTQVQVGIRVPGINYQHSTTISRDSGQSVILPSSVFVSSEISNKTVIVDADAGITVHTMVIGSVTADGFLAVPIIGLGSSYVVASYYPLLGYQQPSHFAISSLDSVTDIEITTSTGNVIQLTLPPYHSYYIQDNDLDLTGSRIEANKPVAVFSGAECSYVPRNIGACDHLAEQMLPLDNLGKSFYIAPFPSRRTAGYIYRIIATNPDDATHVSITGGIEVYLEVGEFFEGHAGGYDIISIEADYPIITVQYMKGRKSGDSTGDPAMLLIPPYEMFSHNVTFSVFDDSRFDFYHASVTISCEDISGLFLDDSTAIDDHWVILSDSDMTGICALQGAITPGVHTIGHTNPNTQFYVAISAVGSSVSYAYSAGFNLLYRLPEDDLTTVQLTTSGQTTYGTTTFDPSCDHHFTALEGTLTSPNYPSNYYNYATCSYIIDLSYKGISSIGFQFNDIYLEACCDKVYYGEGVTVGSRNLGYFTGYNVPFDEVVSGDQMWFYFDSDESVTYRGFSISWMGLAESTTPADPDLITTEEVTTPDPSTIESTTFV